MTAGHDKFDKSIQLDVIVDTMCPWCYLGKRRLEKALEQRPELPVDIRWRPYQLDSEIPPEGMARKDYLERKFGASGLAPTRYKSVTHAGEKDGIHFAFDRIEKSPNTLNSHRLIRWAKSAGCQDAMVERLFELYFVEGQDIGDSDVLLQAAEDVGMERSIVLDLLESDADQRLIETEIAQAREIGVQGVPTYIFGNKFVMSGAQEPSIILAALDQIAAAARDEAETG